uniref:D-aminoacyl-tRNA deacylase n=1 Tax=Periophthalmus magnuspinnatus TaxID=409849 RepID=A0A3B4BIN3_9GOBI
MYRHRGTSGFISRDVFVFSCFVYAAPTVSERPLEARVMVQQCSRARVKTRAGVDGAESQYAERFGKNVDFDCPTVLSLVADSIMNTRFFRTSLRRQVSVLDLRGSVLLVPQESLGFEPGPRRSMQSRGMSEAWVSKQLFSSLYLHCTQLLCARATGEGAVEQGLYGQRQEIEITSTEPMSHMLEF